MRKKSLFIFINFFFALGVLSQVPSSGMSNFQLTGKILDAATGQPLVGASIYFSDLKTGAISDAQGNYFIKNIPVGEHTIEISFVGYAMYTAYLRFEGKTQIDFKLKPAILEQQEVVITGVATATQVRRMVTPMVVVKQTELIKTPSGNIMDLLGRKPGISQISSGPAIAKPVIRGLGYNRVVVLNDGIRQEGQQWGDEHGLEIDDYSVQKIELLKGPASLMYGSDAMAGVIQLLTNTPVAQGMIKGIVQSQYQTNHHYRGTGFQLGANHSSGFNWNIYGSIKAAGDYRNKYDGYVLNSKFNEMNGGGYGGFNGSWGYSHLIVSSFNQNAGVIEGERNDDGRFVMPSGELPSNADFLSTKPSIPWQSIRHFKIANDNSFNMSSGRLQILLGYQQNRRTEYGNPAMPEEKELDFDLTTLQFNTAYHLNEWKQWRLSIGLQSLGQENKNLGEEVLIPAYRHADLGSFIYAQRTFTNMHVSTGIRYDHRFLHSQSFSQNGVERFQEFRQQFSNVSGSVGFSYTPKSSWVIKLNIAKGFRAPTIAELASNGAHEGTNRYEYGNLQLNAESSYQLDAGLEWSTDHLSFGASLFLNRVNDFIYYQKLSSRNGSDSLVLLDGALLEAFQFKQRDANLKGAEFSFDIHPHPLDWLHIENSFSIVNAQFVQAIEGNKFIPFVPGARYVSDLRADLFKKAKKFQNAYINFEIDHNFAQKNIFTLYNTETITQAYTLLNAAVGLDWMNKKKKIATIIFHVKNIADIAYQNHLSRLKYTAENVQTGRTGVFNMGRNFTFKIVVPLSGKVK